MRIAWSRAPVNGGYRRQEYQARDSVCFRKSRARKRGQILAAAISASARRRTTRCLVHVFAIFLDHFTNVTRAQTCLRSVVRDGAAEPHIVAHGVDTAGIFEQIVDILLPDAEASIDIAAIVRLVTFTHATLLVRQGLNSCTSHSMRQSPGLDSRRRAARALPFWFSKGGGCERRDELGTHARGRHRSVRCVL